jgi:hypothetical protein
MDNAGGEKRVLRFGNIEDIIFCKMAGYQITRDKIILIHNELEEYDAEWEGAVPDKDPYQQELFNAIDLLESEQQLILSDIKAFEQELALHTQNTQ